MRIGGFIWLEGIVQKLMHKHAVDQAEVGRSLILLRASGLLKKGIVWAKMFTLLLGKQLPGVT